jgi:hypothetical protein
MKREEYVKEEFLIGGLVVAARPTNKRNEK